MTSSPDTERLPTAPREATSGRRWWRAGMVPLLRRVHFYVALFIGPFLLIAAMTGLLYALSPQLDRMVYSDQLTASRDAGPRTGLDRQVQTAQRLVPDGELAEIRPAPGPSDTTRVSFTVDGVPEGRYRTVFVDPYTAKSHGELTTMGEWLPLRTWLDDLHRHLHLGDTGRIYSELAASWLWVLALSGLGMWLSRRRRRRREVLLPARRGSGRVRLLNRHGAIGAWACLAFLFLSATGLTWSQFAGENVDQVRSQVSWQTPVVADQPRSDAGTATGHGTAPAAGELRADAARVAASAREAGLRAPFKIVPGADATSWTASEAKRSWPEQQDSLAIDPDTGRVVDRVDFGDWPFAAKLARWGIDAHMGLLFGWANQVVLILVALALMSLIVLGYRMWWVRGAAPRALTPPPDGAVDEAASRAAFVVLVVVAGLVALFLPLLGASLMVFLSVDALIRAWRHRRRALSAP